MNAKERKPGCVEISVGRWEVDVFRAHYVCVCACCLYVCTERLLLVVE